MSLRAAAVIALLAAFAVFDAYDRRIAAIFVAAAAAVFVDAATGRRCW